MLMNLPFALPDWMPGWAFLLLALPVLLYLLAFLLMQFSVFGVKARLEALEAQVDSLHDEVRTMAMRAAGVLPPAATRLDDVDDVPNFGRIKKSQRGFTEPVAEPPALLRRAAPVPPVPPAQAVRPAVVPTPVAPVRERLAPSPAAQPRPVRRMEPRLD